MRNLAAAVCMWLVASGGSFGQKITFTGTETTYNGTPAQPRMWIDGVPQDATFFYREISLESASAVFSNRIPEDLPLSYSSLGFRANSTSALGNFVELAGDHRVADYVEVVMVTWATAAKYPELAALDPSGYWHPVSASVHQLNSGADGVATVSLLDEATAMVHIPWRPLTLSDGSAYPYNGYAFKALIPLAASVTVPDTCIIAIGFDTKSFGASPLGVPGPYDELNLALSSALPVVGQDPDPDGVFWIHRGNSYYPARNWGGFGSPILRLAARATALPQPVPDAALPPVNAGIYQARAEVSGGDFESETVLTIAKAPVAFETTGLTRSIADPAPFITVVNSSPGLVAAVTYNGSATVPLRPGKYPFAIAATDRNHSGILTGEFHLTGVTYEQWLQQEFPNSNSNSNSDDPPMWLAYATGGDMRMKLHPLRSDTLAQGMAVSFRQRREMSGVGVALEFSHNLSSWSQLQTATDTIDDFWETISAASASASGYFRLRAEPD